MLRRNPIATGAADGLGQCTGCLTRPLDFWEKMGLAQPLLILFDVFTLILTQNDAMGHAI